MRVYFNLDLEEVRRLRNWAKREANDYGAIGDEFPRLVLSLIPAVDEATTWTPEEILRREG